MGQQWPEPWRQFVCAAGALKRAPGGLFTQSGSTSCMCDPHQVLCWEMEIQRRGHIPALLLPDSTSLGC